MKVNWQLLGPLLVTTLAATAGWFVVNYLTSVRDLRNKAREVRLQYSIAAYRHLEAAASRDLASSNDCSNDYLAGFESAIADIQLFGNDDQIRLAKKLSLAIAEHSPSASTGPLLLSLRNELRGQLGLEPANEEPIHLRLRRSQQQLPVSRTGSKVDPAQ